MKNFKLILKSLISNNACIDGGRKKPWYFAVIMFFLAMILAILPLFVQTLNTHGDDAFATYAYGTDQATLRFNEYLEDNGIKMFVKTKEGASDPSEKMITSVRNDGTVAEFQYNHTIPVKGEDGTYSDQVDYMFFYRSVQDETEFNSLIGDQKTSFMFFYPEQVIIHIVNFNTKETIKNIVCNKAAK